MIRVQTPYKWTQSYAEQCKMKQGTFAAADYGLQQEEAAVVEISPEGMASARRTAAAQLEDQTQTQIQTQAEEQAPIERTGEGTTVTARSIEKLVETVLGGGEVSAEEEQRLNEALPNLIQRQYAEMCRFRLQDERNESESEKQQKLSVEYTSRAGAMQNRYIKGEERSFTIIAFPVSEIGPRYEEIFNEIIRINTLDYQLYQKIQQTIIDTLDKGDYVLVKGMGKNRTNLKVKLHTLKNPDKETNFENCVADVNIPVGEVFTSPQLTGTEGILHVTRVFLNELEYKDISVRFQDGMITEYDCANFDTERENRQYIKDNVLFHHDTLPLGEFAIGTNTTAYVAARKYGIEDKMPILIAEKTGPHFAVGDTCYSHEEEVKSYNPDGKEIVAKENEVSALRDEDMEKAYFNCHTDITIPYDELGELSVVTKDNEVIPIIVEGRFVLAGTEALNEAFL